MVSAQQVEGYLRRPLVKRRLNVPHICPAVSLSDSCLELFLRRDPQGATSRAITG
jgi:hypothetical protein